MANLHQLLKAMLEKGASDLHVTTGTAPQLRVDGSLVPLNMPPLTPQETKQTCYSILTDAQKHRFEAQNELDLSFGVQGAGAIPGEHLRPAGRDRRRVQNDSLTRSSPSAISAYPM